MNTAIKFEVAMKEYGVILREYDETEALCKADGWKSKKLYTRLDEIGRKRDAAAVPLLTLLRKLAKETL